MPRRVRPGEDGGPCGGTNIRRWEVDLRRVRSSEPGLRTVPFVQAVGGGRPAHPGRHPTGIDRVRQRIGTDPGEGHRECRDIELGVVVRAASAGGVGEVDSVEVRGTGQMHGAAQHDRSTWGSQQCREDIGRGDVDRKDRGAVDHAGVVDDRVELTDAIDLLGEPDGLVQFAQVRIARSSSTSAAVALVGQADVADLALPDEIVVRHTSAARID